MGQTGSFKAENAMNGTYGYMYIDGEEVMELEAITTDDSIEYEEINQPGQLRPGRKMTSADGTGEFTVTRINHKLIKKLAKALSEGKQPVINITSTIADPNALESQTTVYYDCTIEKIPYMVAEAKTIIKDKFPFHFAEMRFLD